MAVAVAGALAVTVLSTGVAVATDVGPTSEYCRPGTRAIVSKNTANSRDVKYRTSVTNSTGSKKSFKFSSKRGGTTKFGVSITMTASLKAGVFASIEGSINGSVEKSMTAEVGEEVSGTVKARSTIKGDFGNLKENVSGYTAFMYSNCTYGKKTSFKASAPYRTNWRVYY